eukprot:10528915-Alexandrium_andersonii.AAC.1
MLGLAGGGPARRRGALAEAGSPRGTRCWTELHVQRRRRIRRHRQQAPGHAGSECSAPRDS